jgi:hypothetical protein
MKNSLKVILGVIFFVASIALTPVWFAVQVAATILAGIGALLIALTSKNN